MHTTEPQVPRTEVIKLLDLFKKRWAKEHGQKLTMLEKENAQLKAQLAKQPAPKAYDNCPGEDRNILWKQQLATLRGGVQRQELKTFGESTVKQWLKAQGQGCGGAKARKLVSKLEDEGLLCRDDHGNLGYAVPEANAA